MRQTLFHIPHEFAGFPIFGNGILLYAWLTFAVGLILFSYRKHGWNKETIGHIPILVIVALAIRFVIPSIEETVAGPGAGSHAGYHMCAVITDATLASFIAFKKGFR